MNKLIREVDEKNLIEKFNKRCKELGYHSWLNDILNHEIPSVKDIHPNQLVDRRFLWDPEDGDDSFYSDDPMDLYGGLRNFTQYPMRDVFIHNSGFSIPTKEWIKGMYDLMVKIHGSEEFKVLEICCGLGYISKGLRDLGVEVYATDLKEESYNFDYDTSAWVDVEQLDWVAAVEKYGAEVDFVVCSWPRGRVSDPMRKLYEINPKALVFYIGEMYDGCTADDDFFDDMIFFDYENIDVVEKEFGFNVSTWIDEINKDFPQWYGIHDFLHLARYNPETDCIAKEEEEDG